MERQNHAKAKSELAPGGTLRVGINHGNFLLVRKDEASGETHGVVVDLARELGQRLGAAIELIHYAGSAIRTLADVDRNGVRGVSVAP